MSYLGSQSKCSPSDKNSAKLSLSPTSLIMIIARLSLLRLSLSFNMTSLLYIPDRSTLAAILISAFLLERRDHHSSSQLIRLWLSNALHHCEDPRLKLLKDQKKECRRSPRRRDLRYSLSRRAFPLSRSRAVSRILLHECRTRSQRGTTSWLCHTPHAVQSTP